MAVERRAVLETLSIAAAIVPSATEEGAALRIDHITFDAALTELEARFVKEQLSGDG